MIADHRENVLALKDVEGKSLTLEKLASLKEAPRCHIHTEFLAHLCCCTCGNLPVCITCTYDEHKGHELRDVRKVANGEREHLKEILEELETRKDTVFNIAENINRVNNDVLSIVADTKAKWKKQYEDQTRELQNKKEKEKRDFNRFKTVLEESTRKELKELETEMEEKIRKIRDEYDRMIK
ncbi:putative tripartite motif-containing protein 2-like [Apostichopus japonicus]|uniref:Putative tripartite motif-containing protein 2-like n=1 Tax=Stichopus japonicus TaxID=307972 RepID=A0A2G8JH95_STIJA|nr:putative tripartite motif-containing protein 2-like [Apostichopus japonicus]